MRKINKRLIILFSIILILFIVAGYTVYKAYNINQNNPVKGEEDINLGYKTCNVPGCSSLDNKTCKCEACEPGWKLVGDFCEKKKASCHEGYYLIDGECEECPEGKVCLGGTDQPVSCTDFDRVEDCPSLCNWWESTKECRLEPPLGEACSYVSSVELPGALSPDSNANLKITVSGIPDGVTHGGYCGVSYNINGSGSIAPVHVVSNGAITYNTGISGFEACKEVSLSYSIPNGKSGAKTLRVKTKFTEETKSKDLSGVKNPPKSKTEADGQGTSYYVEDCTDNTKKNCQVHTRDMCYPTPACYYNKDNWSYCWGTACGEGYVVEPNVPQDKCINVCYCNKEKNISGIWALKDWSKNPAFAGYKLVKNGNDYITDNTQCKCPPDFCCVDNGILELSDNAMPITDQVEKVCPKEGWTVLEDVTPENCVIKKPEVGSCSIGNNSKSTKEDASECEGTTKVTLTDTTKCTDNEHDETNFYEIGCTKTINTHFDYGNDGKENTIRSLYKGEGFAFGVNVETSLNCKYIFYDETWTKVYNDIKNIIKKVDSKLLDYLNDEDAWKDYIDQNILNKNGVTDASILYWYWGLAEDLREAVKVYNESTPKNIYNENSELTLTTKEKGKDVTNKYKLKQIVKDEGTYKEENVENKDLKVTGVTNPKSYTLKSNTTRKVTLIPERVCINKKTGKITTIEGDKCPENTLDGGNKIYTSFLTDSNEKTEPYSIKIKVEGLGAVDYTINHDKCDLKVLESEYKYRPIDVENPFINKDWQKGKNWVNEKFDFTQVINNDTWSDNSNQKVIKITGKEIDAIKKSNSDAWISSSSPYMGLCISQDETLQDEITKKLCSLIK